MSEKQFSDDDPFQLTRFVKAQHGFSAILRELQAGEKTGHWMWYVFPQLRGLGRSYHSQFFGLESLDEARAFWSHPVLGIRLQECVLTILTLEHRTALQIFGGIDAKKLHSCLTVFALAVPDAGIFERALQKYFMGVKDRLTVELLGPRE